MKRGDIVVLVRAFSKWSVGATGKLCGLSDPEQSRVAFVKFTGSPFETPTNVEDIAVLQPVDDFPLAR